MLRLMVVKISVYMFLKGLFLHFNHSLSRTLRPKAGRIVMSLENPYSKNLPMPGRYLFERAIALESRLNCGARRSHSIAS
jgi:hypothetical protein